MLNTASDRISKSVFLGEGIQLEIITTKKLTFITFQKRFADNNCETHHERICSFFSDAIFSYLFHMQSDY